MDVIFDLETVKRATFDAQVAIAATANEEHRKQFELVTQGWTAEATHNRELGIPLPPKQPPPPVIHIVADENGWPEAVIGPDTVAPPIPDLPPIPRPAYGITVLIGAALGGGWYQALPGDNAPNGYVAENDGGKYVKVTYPFGGWWQKV